MITSVKKIQSGLSEIINERVKINFIKKYAHIFIFLTPIHSLLYYLTYSDLLYSILYWTDGLCYVASLVGLAICFSKNDMKRIGIYFILQVIEIFFGLIKGYAFNINTVVYLAFYIFMADKALKYNRKAKASCADMLCSKCGSQLKEGASFCGVCGTKIE